LSPSKLACLRFLHAYLLVPLLPGRGRDWMQVDLLRQPWIEQGEWAGLAVHLASTIEQQQQQQQQLARQVAAAAAAVDANADMAAVASNVAPTASAFSAGASASSFSSPLLSRCVEMLDLLLSLLLNCGAHFHPQGLLDYNMLQEQLLPLFAQEVEEEQEQSPQPRAGPIRVYAGPYWSLPLHLQHKCVQLLYYFEVLQSRTLQLLLECLRDHTAPTADANAASSHVSLSLPAKHLLLDMLQEKFAQSCSVVRNGAPAPWPLMQYVSFVLAMLRTDLSRPAESSSPASFDPARVSPLLPVACRMLRDVGAEEVDAALQQALTPAQLKLRNPAVLSPSSPSVLLELLAPVLAASLAEADASVASKSSTLSSSSSLPRLDALSGLVLLDALLAHCSASPSSSSGSRSLADVSVPPSVAAVLPGVLCALLCHSLSGSALEAGLVRVPAGWLASPADAFVSQQQQQQQPQQQQAHGNKAWLLAMRLLLVTESARLPSAAAGAHTPLASALQLLSAKLRPKQRAAHPADAMQAVVVLTALTKCAGVRDLLTRPQHQQAVLDMAADIQRQQGVASQTLVATLQAELTLLFGSRAEQARG